MWTDPENNVTPTPQLFQLEYQVLALKLESVNANNVNGEEGCFVGFMVCGTVQMLQAFLQVDTFVTCASRT